MAMAIKHRISGFDVKAPYSMQQLLPLATLPEASPAAASNVQGVPHAPPWASNSLPQQEAEGGIRFHDWFPTRGRSTYSRSAPRGEGGHTATEGGGNAQRAEGVKAFQDMCSASRSMTAVDSPTMLRQNRVEVGIFSCSSPSAQTRPHFSDMVKCNFFLKGCSRGSGSSEV